MWPFDVDEIDFDRITSFFVDFLHYRILSLCSCHFLC